MRQAYYSLTVIFSAVLLLIGCSANSSRHRYINISDVPSCNFYAHTFNISYEIVGSKAQDVTVSAWADAEWVTNIDTSRPGRIVVSVDNNDGDDRSTTIHITADGFPEAELTITQLAARDGLATHTLIYYFFGTSLSRYFGYNLEDAATAISSGALGTNNRVVFVRQTSTTEAYIGELCYNAIDGSCTERRIDDIIIDATRPMSENIKETIAMLVEIAPAERYGMVLAGHGQGWVTREALESSSSPFSVGGGMWTPAFGAEITRAFGENNVRVDISELAQGIDEAGVKFDYLLFDACFMSNIETLYDLRNSANYIIASPCEIMGRGFPYHNTLPYLFAENGTRSDLIGAAESYYTYYRDEYDNTARCGSVALIDCSELENMATATRNLVKGATNDVDINKLQFYEGHRVHTFFDFGQWGNTISNDNAAVDAFNTQLSKTVIAKYTISSFYSALGNSGTYPIDESVYSGITTSAPSYTYPDYWVETSWYKAVWE